MQVTEFDDHDIIDGRSTGGANTSHTIAFSHLSSLLAALPRTAGFSDYEHAAVEQNLLGRATLEGRRRTFRYLRELYLFDPERVLFRALRDLWDEDTEARPLLAGLAAFARDSVFRASGTGLLKVAPGETVSPGLLSEFVATVFPDAYNAGTAGKIGRNTASSWAQTGHLVGLSVKHRQRVVPSPASVSYALLLGHLQGYRGQSLYDTNWTQFLDSSPREIELLAEAASRRGYVELKSAGGVVEIGFRHLTRSIEGVKP
jgi:hypothetical protein